MTDPATASRMQRLNRYYEGQSKIYCRLDRRDLLLKVHKEPELTTIERVTLPADYAARDEWVKTTARLAVQHRRELKYNDRHSFLFPEAVPAIEQTFTPRLASLEVILSDYALVRAWRKNLEQAYRPGCPEFQSALPWVLSANCLIVYEEQQCLIINRRAANLATYGGQLHTYGGGNQPGVDDHPAPAGYSSLLASAIRETGEESSIDLNFLREEPSLELYLAREVQSGFIQLMVLGANIGSEHLPALGNNWEGSYETIPFDELEETLLADIRPPRPGSAPDRWVPTGKAHTLLWLAADTPGLNVPPTFNGRTARTLFDDVMDQLEQYADATGTGSAFTEGDFT